jgi:hypothetical protein
VRFDEFSGSGWCKDGPRTLGTALLELGLQGWPGDAMAAVFFDSGKSPIEFRLLRLA